MSARTRIVLALASLLLLVMYVTPMWRITLEAPQYPEGLGLQIHLSTIDGIKQHDLQNINNLNHYIGMKRIEPDAIPELRIMPWAIAGLIVLGLVAAGTGSRTLLYVWVVTFVLLAAAGLIDFYLWAYDYGHNLNTETAAIKVPGMTYQPPIIGSKKLLNFTAHSWPALGGWAAFVSMGTGIVLAALELRRRPSRLASALVILIAAGLTSGCSRTPEPFVFNEDRDAFCRMTISDPAFATQIVTTSGRSLKFDSIECLAGYLASETGSAVDVHSAWVTDAAGQALIAADEAIFVQSPSIRSPMGGGYVAYADADDAERRAASVGGAVMDWDTVLATETFERGHAAH